MKNTKRPLFAAFFERSTQFDLFAVAIQHADCYDFGRLSCSLIFAPVLIGPEGSYVPLVVTLPFLLVEPIDMLDMLYSHPYELLLTFACAVCVSTGNSRLRFAWASKSSPAPDGADSGAGNR